MRFKKRKSINDESLKCFLHNNLQEIFFIKKVKNSSTF